MRIYHRGDKIPREDTAVALGTFDGMHLGHRSIIERMVREADGMRTAAYTFRNIPAAYFGGRAEALFTEAEKISAFEALGVDVLVLEEFDRKIAEISPERFVDRLTDGLGARKIYAGFNYTFGAAARGTSMVLERLARERGLKVYLPDKPLCGDNAAMIASQGYYEYLAGNTAGMDLNACAQRSIE